MKRGLALWCLGVWAMGTAAIALAATRNFAVVDELLATLPNPVFAGTVESLGSVESRELLRYLSSEINRALFAIWGWVQLPLGGLVLWLVWNEAPGRARYGVLAMLALVVALTFALTPPIVEVGRGLDFVPRDPEPPGLRTFGLLHAAYSVAEFLKLGLGLAVAFWLAAFRAPAARAGR